MISVNSPFYFDRDRLRRWSMDIAIRKWRRHEFKFPEVFLQGALRSNALELVSSSGNHASVPSEETTYNVRLSEDL